MLVFENVQKRYGDGPAVLDGVSFQVPRGQFCVLLGASGAGKSTLLKSVNGLVSPTGGRVLVDGQAVTGASLRALRPRIGMIHQHFNLTPRATAAANVVYGALPEIPAWRAATYLFPAGHKAKALELVAAVGLEARHLRQRAETLSGGQQQRIGIARAFMLDPPLILADEPVASLDPRISRDIMDLLRRQAARAGSTVLCSLHQIDLARDYADRIVALAGGRVVFDGPPAALDEGGLSQIYQVADAGAVRAEGGTHAA